MKSVCKLNTTEDRVRYDACNHALPPISRTSLLVIGGLLTAIFFIDWMLWDGNLFGNGKFYLDDFLSFLPHLRIHHYHDGILLLILAGIGWLVWMWRREHWCCTNRRWLIDALSVGFYLCIIAGIFLIVRDFNDVLLWWETGNFFPDPV